VINIEEAGKIRIGKRVPLAIQRESRTSVCAGKNNRRWHWRRNMSGIWRSPRSGNASQRGGNCGKNYATNDP
jgi:hypothetical protein